jgi:DNA repair protein NreA
MHGVKGAYLKKLTAAQPMPSARIGTTLEGTSPPSVFVGSWNYPKVYAGPMISPSFGDIRIMDTPECWIPGGLSQDDIVGYRMSLVRGKYLMNVRDLSSRFAEQLRDIALSSASLESEAVFSKPPQGGFAGEEHTPFGPSACLDRFETGSARWENGLEKVYYDTDLTATDALLHLHAEGHPFSLVQKALSAGTIGRKRDRRLVPTRWAITACDTALGNTFLSRLRTRDTIDTFRVHEFSSLHNHYAVILMPVPWEFEWIEAFLHITGNEELIFSDHERNRGKKEYSCVGGCYYSSKMAVLEALCREGKQAGVIILREARKGYIPMGVFNVRENVRHAMLQTPVVFEDLSSSLNHVSQKFQLPVSRYVRESTLLAESCRQRQMHLSDFSGTQKVKDTS